MSTIQAKLKVFWDKTGHFVAAYYNQNYFDGLGTAFFTLIREGYNYRGKYEPAKPEG